MNSFEIYKRLSHLRSFRGVYPIDRIPRLRPGVFVVNNQSANLGGQHWMAVSVGENFRIYYFDPLGFPPPMLLVKQLGAAEIKYNKIQYQDPLSTDCGRHVIRFCLNPEKYK